MSNPESFIDEVTEEVRRDRLYGVMRRWGWLAILVVILLVGGAAFAEWRRSQSEARARTFGAAVLDALDAEDLAARRAALEGVAPSDEGQAAILSFLQATAALNAGEGDLDAARSQLLDVAVMPDLPAAYRDLARLKVMLAGGTGDTARDAELLETLAAPGAPYRPMAVELQALMALEAGDEATALTLLRALTEDAEATESLRRRATQLIVALGATPEPA
ncbi:hypothetical protein [uncultured Jannaschia sp.]|uniref:tetratricopeptide repeat protein n=1 Tax=uncultured Jannaschia sp. TaxID=293347 RepID=UPI0026047DB3|nr:hypothetical protein [uncultured Jannaschia sp.]